MLSKTLKVAAVALIAGGTLSAAVTPVLARQVTVVITPKNEKRANAWQKGLQFLSAVQQRRNLARVNQRGSDNSANVSQSGSGNTAGVFQRGRGHTANVEQSGDNNYLGLFQFGRNTNANTVQTGNGKAIVIQRGW